MRFYTTTGPTITVEPTKVSISGVQDTFDEQLNRAQKKTNKHIDELEEDIAYLEEQREQLIERVRILEESNEQLQVKFVTLSHQTDAMYNVIKDIIKDCNELKIATGIV